MTPSRIVWPCATWAVIAKPGARGNCVRVTRSSGLHRCRSKYQHRRIGATGYTLSSASPSIRHVVEVLNRTYIIEGNVFHILALPLSVAGVDVHPAIVPWHPFRIPLCLSKWSVARTGIPMANGNTPYSPLHSLSWRCNQTSFSSFRSPFSRNTAAEAMSRAMAKWTLSCFCCAHCLARSLFTWYFTSFVLNMATACWNAAEYRGSVVLAATRRREARSSAQAPHSVAQPDP